MAQQPARARLPRWRSTLTTLSFLLLCLVQPGGADLVPNEDQQLRDILDLALVDAFGKAPR